MTDTPRNLWNSLRPWLRRLGLPISLLLLGLCIWQAISLGNSGGGGDSGGGGGWQRIAHADPLHLTGLIACVLANTLLPAILFWMLNKPFEHHRPVSGRDMLALIAATSLLNYFMRAGLVGRVAYLRQKHDITLVASFYIMMLFLAGLVIVSAALLTVVLWRGSVDALGLTLDALLLLAAAALAAPLLAWAVPRGVQGPGRWFAWENEIRATGESNPAFPGAPRPPGRVLKITCLWFFLLTRTADVFCYAGRLWFAGQIFGTPLPLHHAILFAVAGMFVTMLTPLPNGLGLREWLYGLLAQAGFGGEQLQQLSTGLALGLVDRTAEALVFIPTGLIALLYLRKRVGWGRLGPHL